MLKTHIESINLSFANGFVYENVSWALASLRVFFYNYVLYSLGLILKHIFRFHEFSHLGYCYLQFQFLLFCQVTGKLNNGSFFYASDFMQKTGKANALFKMIHSIEPREIRLKILTLTGSQRSYLIFYFRSLMIFMLQLMKEKDKQSALFYLRRTPM